MLKKTDQSGESVPNDNEMPRPDPEVVPGVARRRFTARYKLKIVEEADRCENAGEIGALLRREGLYSSHLSNWRRLRDEGALSALSTRRGAKRKTRQPRVQQLERENDQLRQELQKARCVIDVQKKVSQLLALTDSTLNDASN